MSHAKGRGNHGAMRHNSDYAGWYEETLGGDVACVLIAEAIPITPVHLCTCCTNHVWLLHACVAPCVCNHPFMLNLAYRVDGISNLAERDGAVGLLATSDQAVSDAEQAIIRNDSMTCNTNKPSGDLATSSATTTATATTLVHGASSTHGVNGHRAGGSKEVDDEMFTNAMEALTQEVCGLRFSQLFAAAQTLWWWCV